MDVSFWRTGVKLALLQSNQYTSCKLLWGQTLCIFEVAAAVEIDLNHSSRKIGLVLSHALPVYKFPVSRSILPCCSSQSNLSPLVSNNSALPG